MLSPDYQEFANRTPPATRDNTVISGLGTDEVIEITPALLDCHEKSTKAELSACRSAQNRVLRRAHPHLTWTHPDRSTAI
ncbi:hypothetical protein ABIG06_006768 [Bradyrhizobium sp. USDA 326]|uniref:hypothetical protein n=2 Tax=Nitrobacteraceae TaxID=41294 RepID=UPI000F5475C7|nr:hypothetical protein [Bradyrhizobium sp. RP6]RQH16220.1 hypothetical protein EHH60_03315 [Bradyrhizobium sp. RP6]